MRLQRRNLLGPAWMYGLAIWLGVWMGVVLIATNGAPWGWTERFCDGEGNLACDQSLWHDTPAVVYAMATMLATVAVALYARAASAVLRRVSGPA